MNTTGLNIPSNPDYNHHIYVSFPPGVHHMSDSPQTLETDFAEDPVARVSNHIT